MAAPLVSGRAHHNPANDPASIIEHKEIIFFF
jgi:hypothetical protein